MADASALPVQGATDVVGKLPALGPLAGVGFAAVPTAEESAQEEFAAHAGWPLHRGCTLMQRLLHRVEQLTRD